MTKLFQLLLVAFLITSVDPLFAKPPLPATFPTGDASVTTTQPSTLFNGWKLSPAGTHVRVSEMPLKMALSPDGALLATVCSGLRPGLALIDVNQRQLLQFIALPATFNGVAFSNDGKQLFVTGGNSDSLHIFPVENAALGNPKTISLSNHPQRPRGHGKGPDDFLAGIAVHPQTGKLYICNEAASEIWVFNPAAGKLETTYRTGEHPHSCIFGLNPQYLYVSNWGDRSVTAIDIKTGKIAVKTPVGVRPNDTALAPDGRLFVACSGDNTVHVLQTKTPPVADAAITEAAPPRQDAMEIISTSLYPASPEGSAPDGLAVSPDGKALFIVNADNNDCVIVDISNPRISRVEGFVPVGWFPTAVVSNGKSLIVANGKGLSSHPNFPAHAADNRKITGITFDSASSGLWGSVSFIDPPVPADLLAYTRQVRDNSPYTPATLRQTAAAPDSIIPHRPGQDCPIKHILYIIKENRTYDQVYGDFRDASGNPAGNGEPRICMFGESITPNQHQLARDYVLLDNLYCSGEVSVDGHSWCDAAIATDFNQRSWIISYSGHGKLPGNTDMARPTAGYLWDQCRAEGITYKTYGEMVKSFPNSNRGTWPGKRDPEKVRGWIADLKAAEESGDLPAFMVMSLGENHTTGTKPGTHTPQACVASNDVAMGMILEAATHSKFWKEMAIFVIEDDAQNGPDHVDSHRTAGLVLSPWCRRGIVDSTPYTTTSMVRTIELILGLHPMTQYDAAATPMFNCFQKNCQEFAYSPLTPKVDLAATNTKAAPGAKASAEMDFDEYDEAPEDELNRILWSAVKGEDAPYPTPIHGALFTR